ncbi:MAG: N-acetylmuramoyl-L-alanine amidase [Deltaproteobacteria bacterium]|nr:N-acetylmuramoyl-L-alanine amidase [Deltaproteobacteria bacterium]
MNSHSRIISNTALLELPKGLVLRNFHDPSVVRFKGRKRRIPVTEVIVHETVTTSVAATVRILQRRRLGVHFIIGPDGEVTQHGDIQTDLLYHAGFHNRPSVGIETVTPFYPEYLKENSPWKKVIDAPWAHKGAYVVPTPEQAEATSLLVDWLSSEKAKGIRIPKTWIGLDKKGIAMGRTHAAKRRIPGLFAHTYFGHSDGAWLILYAWLRLEAGLTPVQAYDEAIRRAVGVRRFANLSGLVKHHNV